MSPSVKRRFAGLILCVLTALGLLAAPVSAEPAPNTPSISVGKVEALANQAGPQDPNSITKSLSVQSAGPEAAFPADCPITIRCIVVPAAFTPNNGNIEDYGNYDTANRPSDGMKIDSIVIHDGEGTCQAIVDAFKNPLHYASTQYVVCANGLVVQMVQNRHVPWHAGNWYYNTKSIGVEHEGHAALGGTEYTWPMLWASSQLIRHLMREFSISPDQVIGHDNIPAVKNSQIATMHTDPGPFWNWDVYRKLIGAPVRGSINPLTSQFVTVAPVWPLSKQLVTGCSPGNDNGCVPNGLQPTNFVYLRTAPDSNAPLFTDPVLGQGSTDINNNAARLFHGQTFRVIDRQSKPGSVWYKVAVNGSSGWFESPWSAPTAFSASGQCVTPKAGQTSAPAYGRPRPELSEYPQAVPVPGEPGVVKPLLQIPPASFWIPTLAPTAPLSYTIPAGQCYRVIARDVPNYHFYAWSINADRTQFPYDHWVFPGQQKFDEIQLGNRRAFVNQSDVELVG